MDKYVYFGVFALILTSAYATPTEECDKSKCKGPLRYYQEVSCTPLYKDGDDCCPYKYDCDHLKTRKPDKCYVNGHEYNLGESLRDEDKNPCDIGCFCRESLGVAGFSCAVVDCPRAFYPPPTRHPTTDRPKVCYTPKSADDCCDRSPICVEKEEDIPTCEVAGTIYKAGEYFNPPGEPNKDCYCGAGYSGENVEPFCRIKSTTSLCGLEMRHAYEIKNHCPPSYYSSQSPQTDCAYAYRCQNDRDQVMKPNGTAVSVDTKSAEGIDSNSTSDDMMCQFGTLKMHLGEELNQQTGYASVCVKCVCEVPPVPTCQRLPDDICDVTVHPDFTNYD